MIISINTVALL